MQGIIKAVKGDKGYGFISVESKPDAFFHRNDIDMPFDEDLVGKRVDFELLDGERGPRAVAIRPVKSQ